MSEREAKEGERGRKGEGKREGKNERKVRERESEEREKVTGILFSDFATAIFKLLCSPR